jgi:hypothetical protein
MNMELLSGPLRLRKVPLTVPILLRVLGIDNHKLALRVGGNLGALMATGNANYCLMAGSVTKASSECITSMTTFS